MRGERRSSKSTRVLLSTVAMCATALVAASCSAPPLVPNPDIGQPVVQIAAPDVVPPLRMVDGELVDGTGRIVLLHGVNSVRKDAPFISTAEPGWLGPLEREYLRRSGFNAVRLGVTFAALMPEPGVVDEDYLDKVVDTTELLAADGMWVQLDFHQDVFHQMPPWATPADAQGLSEQAPELFSFIGWAAGYLSPKSLRQWDSFLAGEPHVGGRSVASVLGDAAAALAAHASPASIM